MVEKNRKKKTQKKKIPQGMEWGMQWFPYSSAQTSQAEPGLRVSMVPAGEKHLNGGTEVDETGRRGNSGHSCDQSPIYTASPYVIRYIHFLCPSPIPPRCRCRQIGHDSPRSTQILRCLCSTTCSLLALGPVLPSHLVNVPRVTTSATLSRPLISVPGPRPPLHLRPSSSL